MPDKNSGEYLSLAALTERVVKIETTIRVLKWVVWLAVGLGTIYVGWLQYSK